MATLPREVPVLEVRGVKVRPYDVADAGGIVERSRDEQTGQWTGMPRGLTVEAAQEWIVQVGQQPSERQLSWALEVEGRYAGQVGLRPEGDGGHIHYDTTPWARGRGVAGVAAHLVSQWALHDLGWAVVIWRAHADNVASVKTAWRAGFNRPLRVPYALVLEGKLVDGWWSVMTPTSTGEPVTARWEDYLPAS